MVQAKEKEHNEELTLVRACHGYPGIMGTGMGLAQAVPYPHLN